MSYEDVVRLNAQHGYNKYTGAPRKYPERQQESQVWIFSVRFSIKLEDDWEEIKTRLDAWFKRHGADWVYQLESTGSEILGTLNKHFQGFLKAKERIRGTTLAINSNDEFAGIEIRACSNAGRLALKDYCMKKETRIAGPWGCRDIYTGADLYTVPYPWQAFLEYYVTTQPVQNREIVWVYDEKGNSGKSQFGKKMWFEHGALYLTYATTANLINVVYKAKNRKIIIIDLTRARPKDVGSDDLYAALESIKNGMIMNSKYETDVVGFSPPHMIVLSNQLPEPGKMSADRYVKYKMVGNDIQLVA